VSGALPDDLLGRLQLLRRLVAAHGSLGGGLPELPDGYRRVVGGLRTPGRVLLWLGPGSVLRYPTGEELPVDQARVEVAAGVDVLRASCLALLRARRERDMERSLDLELEAVLRALP